MSEYQKLVAELYNTKLKKYRLNPDIISDKLKDQFAAEAAREALMQVITFGGGFNG